jgi:hypothetical protein
MHQDKRRRQVALWEGLDRTTVHDSQSFPITLTEKEQMVWVV